MKECLKSGKRTCDDPSEGSGRGFVFSMEAVLSLLACTAFVALLSTQAHENFNDVVVYKQASDVLELALEDGSLEARDVKHIRSLLRSVELRGRITLDGDVLFDDSPNVLVTVQRTLVTKEGKYVRVILEAGKK